MLFFFRKFRLLHEKNSYLLILDKINNVKNRYSVNYLIDAGKALAFLFTFKTG